MSITLTIIKWVISQINWNYFHQLKVDSLINCHCCICSEGQNFQEKPNIKSIMQIINQKVRKVWEKREWDFSIYFFIMHDTLENHQKFCFARIMSFSEFACLMIIFLMIIIVDIIFAILCYQIFYMIALVDLLVFQYGN